MKDFQKTTLKLLALCAVGAIIMAPGGLLPAQATGITKNVQGDTGCISTGPNGTVADCSLISPNYGITWTGHWLCVYDSYGTYVGTYYAHCDWAYNNGCCNNLDGAAHCPNYDCPPSYP